MASSYKDNLEESEVESEDTNSSSEDTSSEDDCGDAAGTPSLPIATSLHTLTKTAINVKKDGKGWLLETVHQKDKKLKLDICDKEKIENDLRLALEQCSIQIKSSEDLKKRFEEDLKTTETSLSSSSKSISSAGDAITNSNINLILAPTITGGVGAGAALGTVALVSGPIGWIAAGVTAGVTGVVTGIVAYNAAGKKEEAEKLKTELESAHKNLKEREKEFKSKLEDERTSIRNLQSNLESKKKELDELCEAMRNNKGLERKFADRLCQIKQDLLRIDEEYNRASSKLAGNLSFLRTEIYSLSQTADDIKQQADDYC